MKGSDYYSYDYLLSTFQHNVSHPPARQCTHIYTIHPRIETPHIHTHPQLAKFTVNDVVYIYTRRRSNLEERGRAYRRA